MQTKAVWLLGLPVHPITREEARAAIEEFAADGQTHLIITADASALILARRDKEFRRIFRSASLVTPDGAGVVQALRFLGRPVSQRVCGADLAVDLAEMASEHGWSMFLMGAEPGVAEEAAKRLVERFSGLKIAGCQDGYFTDDEPVVHRIEELRPDILLVAMGMPKQEKWFWKHRDRLGVRIAMGVGGTLDVLSGRVKRAPGFFQRHGLEWLYRVATRPPSKSAKLALLPVFGALAIREIGRKRRLGKVIKKGRSGKP